MKKRQLKKDNFLVYLLAGILFLLLELLVISRNGSNYLNFIWFCNFAPLLFAIFFFFKNVQAIKGLINLALVTDIFFLIDFFSSLLFNFGIFGRVQPYFGEGILFISITVLLHMAAFIALFVTYKIKPTKEALKYSVLFLLFTYFITLLFSPTNMYYNYVYATRPGFISAPFPHFYLTVLWPILMFLLVILPSYWIQYKIYQFFKK
jgi:hypothetical protein